MLCLCLTSSWITGCILSPNLLRTHPSQTVSKF
jgi:hypothetical protein